MRAILSWLKIFPKRLSAFLLSSVVGLLVAMVAMMTVLVFFKWLFDVIIFERQLTMPETLWYSLPVAILAIILAIRLQERFYKWLAPRFGLRQKAGLKTDNNDS